MALPVAHVLRSLIPKHLCAVLHASKVLTLTLPGK